MVFDREVTFWTENGSQYNAATSKNEPRKQRVGQSYANVTDLGTDRSQILFGTFLQRAYVIRLTSHPPTVWGYLSLDGDTRIYRQKTTRRVLKGDTIIVQEDDSHGQR